MWYNKVSWMQPPEPSLFEAFSRILLWHPFVEKLIAYPSDVMRRRISRSLCSSHLNFGSSSRDAARHLENILVICSDSSFGRFFVQMTTFQVLSFFHGLFEGFLDHFAMNAFHSKSFAIADAIFTIIKLSRIMPPCRNRWNHLLGLHVPNVHL